MMAIITHLTENLEDSVMYSNRKRERKYYENNERYGGSVWAFKSLIRHPERESRESIEESIKDMRTKSPKVMGNKESL